MSLPDPTRAWALREGGDTQRMHTVPHVGDASVARHSFNMALLAWQLAPPTVRDKLIRACLLHDLAERWIGDVPATAKYAPGNEALRLALDAAENQVERSLGIYVDLNPEERTWLKALDVLELLMHCDSEIALGNQHLRPTRANCIALLDTPWVPERVYQFLACYGGFQRTTQMPGEVMAQLKEAVR